MENVFIDINTRFLIIGLLFAITVLLMYIAFYKNPPAAKRVMNLESRAIRISNYRREALPSGISTGIDLSKQTRNFSGGDVIFGVILTGAAVTSAILATAINQRRHPKKIIEDLIGRNKEPQNNVNKS